MTGPFSLDPLLPAGWVLLTASFGWVIIRVTKGEETLEVALERLVVAFLAMTFFRSAASMLDTLSDQLTELIRSASHQYSLRSTLLEAFARAAKEDSPSHSLNNPGMASTLAQAWSTGVWGIMSQLVDWVYLLCAFVMESARTVFWRVLFLLLPIAAAVFPIYPVVLTSFAFFALELALWLPILAAIEGATGEVARSYFLQGSDRALAIVSVEVLAILLIIKIPGFVRSLLRGGLGSEPGSLSSAVSTLAMSKALLVRRLIR